MDIRDELTNYACAALAGLLSSGEGRNSTAHVCEKAWEYAVHMASVAPTATEVEALAEDRVNRNRLEGIEEA